jgi:hypothetical protein
MIAHPYVRICYPFELDIEISLSFYLAALV